MRMGWLCADDECDYDDEPPSNSDIKKIPMVWILKVQITVVDKSRNYDTFYRLSRIFLQRTSFNRFISYHYIWQIVFGH